MKKILALINSAASAFHGVLIGLGSFVERTGQRIISPVKVIVQNSLTFLAILIERTAARLMNPIKTTLHSVSTIIERIGSRLFGGGALRRGLANVDEVVAGKGGKLFHPLKNLTFGFLEIIEGTLDRTRNHPLFKWLFTLFYPFVSALVFLRFFFKTRNRVAWLAIALMLVSLGMTFAVQRILDQSNARLSERYRNAMLEQMSKGNLNEASLYKARLLTLGLSETDFEMNQIHRLVEAGKVEQAFAFAESIAPADRPGFADAHFWIAQQLLNGKTKLPLDEAVEKAEAHLEHLRASVQQSGFNDTELPAVTFVRAQIAFHKKRDAEGMKLLMSISKFWPATMDLIERSLKQSNPSEALRFALTLYNETKRQPEIVADLSEANFAIWCTALAGGGDGPELVEALNLWRQRFPDNAFVQEEVASVRLLQVDTLISRGSTTDIARAGEILVEATRDLPLSSHALISRWATVRLLPKGQNPGFEKAVELVMAKENVPSMLLEIVGTAFAWEQDFGRASELFQRAVQANPENAIAWNGLALMKFHSDRLKEAMDCANTAVSLDKGNAVYLQTRGLIGSKLKQWDQVISDLRQVVAENPGSKPDHLLLAEAYQAVGNQAMFELHQAQASN